MSEQENIKAAHAFFEAWNAGDQSKTALFVFADLAGYAAWQADEAISKFQAEAWQYTDNRRVQLLGPSPVVPQPLRPQR